jgi:UDP-perosamine 4-acetyltransferase
LDIIVLGSKGHAKVCIEILQSMGERIAFCVGADDSDDFCMGIPVLKGDKHLIQLRLKGFSRVFPAIGDNKLRERLSMLAVEHDYELVNAISSYAVISPSAKIGAGVAVMPGAVINADVWIDDLVVINTGATIDHDCRVERAAHIAPQCGLTGHVSVGKQSFLGAGCCVIPKVSISENVIVGAGGVVISNIPANVLALGAPTKITKHL